MHGPRLEMALGGWTCRGPVIRSIMTTTLRRTHMPVQSIEARR